MLMVTDMDRAVAFYRDTFGLRPGVESPYWSELAFGDAALALHAGAAAAVRDTGLALQVDDLDEACALVLTHGGQVLSNPEDRPEEGIRLATVADPEGNRFSVGQQLRQ